MHRLKIVIAPSGFKESLSAEDVADAIETGIGRVARDAEICKLPLVDGGEGFTRTLVHTTGGELFPITVTNAVGEKIEAAVGILGGEGTKTAVIELAAAAGLRTVPRGKRDPLTTTTFGVGELIAAALDQGAERILAGCGDSGTNDGGAGMAQALGARLLDVDGKQIGFGGGELSRLEKIDLTGLDARLKKVQIDVACNIHNILCGENGVARVFGPQKGASPETVETLAAGLDNFADVVERDLGIDVRSMPGGGASGGTGAGMHALLGAKLHPRFDIVTEYLDLDGALAGADLVFTAEGMIDSQTTRGKIPAEVARRCKEHGIPVIVIAGMVGKDAEKNYEEGVDAMFGIIGSPADLEHSMANAPELIARCAENIMRLENAVYRKLRRRDLSRSQDSEGEPLALKTAHS